MSADRRTLIVPLLLIALGIGWLLTTLGVAPQIDWLWTLGLAAVGVLIFAVNGFDKVTLVLGPLFLTASTLSVLRQTGRIKLDVEIPVLVILTGVLLLIVRSRAIPAPKWFYAEPGIQPGKS
jgi:hypothetical protein